MLCVWWDQESVIYYELLKPGETVNAHRYHQQSNCTVFCVKKGCIWKRYDKLIFLHDNAPSHTSTMVQNYLETLNWEVLPHSAYTRSGIFWLSPVFIDGLRARWAALRFLRRRPKIAWWVVCLERWGIFLAWYSQIAWKMRKMYS